MVSVILPNYNHASYLERRIHSILNQTYSDLELIILDDCSTDDSRKVIERYRSNPKVSQIILNEKNSGSTFQQWKRGIELAKGEWIWMAESDDWCEPSFLEELITPLMSSENYVLGFCQSLMVTPEYEIINKTLASYLSETLDGKEFVRKSMAGTNHIVNASMCLFKKKTYTQVAGGYEEMKYCGDWLFWVQVCLQGQVYISGKYLNYYLRHKANVASKAIALGYDFTEGAKIYQFINKELGLSDEERKNALDTMLRLYFVLRDRFLDKSVHAEVLKILYSLHPSVQGMMQVIERKKRFKKLDSSLRHYLKKLIIIR